MNRNFKEIQYLNSIGHLLIKPEMKNNILDSLDLNLSRSVDKYFCFMKQEDINELVDYEYLCTYHLKSRRIFLYLTIYSGINFTFYIDNGELISVKHRFSQELYENGGTLFEGELALNKVLLSDILIWKGERTNNLTGLNKLNLLNNIIDKDFIPDEILDVSNITVKDFVHYYQLESFWKDYKQTLSYKDKINGIIFRPIDKLNRNIVLIEDKCELNIKKKYTQLIEKTNKRIDHNKYKLICFKMYKTKSPDVYNLFLSNGKNEVFYEFASIPTIRISKKIAKLINYHKYLIVNCNFDNTFKRWMPIQKSSRRYPDNIDSLT